ncbi:phage holin family protein [Plantibacter sp. Mn2098]|uniref:phage holin family protein n=1 Tax=Plantibacter sp. Mn2098 TaxID=3395266 RepID=UPI003BDB1C63
MTDTRNGPPGRSTRPGASPGRSSAEWSTSAGARRARRRLPPVSELLADLRDDLIRLVQAEIALFKAEMTKKATSLGIGAGLLVSALVLVFFAFGTLIAAAVLGLATVLPAWLSALIVGGALLIIAAVLALVGLRKLKTGGNLKPERSIEALLPSAGATNNADRGPDAHHGDDRKDSDDRQ